MIGQLPIDIVEQIDALTAADTKLYVAAAQRLLATLKGMQAAIRRESPAWEGFTLLCPARLERLMTKTSYLGNFALRQFIDNARPYQWPSA